MATIRQVKERQPDWFSRGNRRMFGDVEYKVLHGKTTGDPYLVRKTSMWSDMFGKPKTFVWRVNSLDDSLKIGPLVETVFNDLWAVKRWMKGA